MLYISITIAPGYILNEKTLQSYFLGYYAICENGF
jgi:hypothetical protein